MEGRIQQTKVNWENGGPSANTDGLEISRQHAQFIQ